MTHRLQTKLLKTSRAQFDDRWYSAGLSDTAQFELHSLWGSEQSRQTSQNLLEHLYIAHVADLQTTCFLRWGFSLKVRSQYDPLTDPRFTSGLRPPVLAGFCESHWCSARHTSFSSGETGEREIGRRAREHGVFNSDQKPSH